MAKWKDPLCEDVGVLRVTNVEERDDGGANYTFDMDEKVALKMANLGLELTFYCAAYKTDIQDVFDWIQTQGQKEKTGD